MKKAPTSKLENADLAGLIGKHTYLRILWKDWKKELPPANKQIFVIIQLDSGYYPVTAEFLDPNHFKMIKFDDASLPSIYLGDKETKRLVAWGVLRKIDAPK